MGRGKKVVLIVGEDEEETSLQRYVLETLDYRVLVAHDAESAEALHGLGVDAVLGMGEIASGWWELAEAMKRRRPDVPLMLLGVPDVAAASVLLPRRVHGALLVERLRCVLSLRAVLARKQRFAVPRTIVEKNP